MRTITSQEEFIRLATGKMIATRGGYNVFFIASEALIVVPLSDSSAELEKVCKYFSVPVEVCKPVTDPRELLSSFPPMIAGRDVVFMLNPRIVMGNAFTGDALFQPVKH